MRSILLTTLLATAALAQDANSGQRRGPPAEARAACSGQSEGTACGFTLNGHNLVGTCRAGPNGEATACMPAGGPGGGMGGPRGPPAEATAACANQSAGASCSFTHHDRTLNGTCRTGPDGSGTLACMPAGGPGGHRGPPPEATAGCASLSAGASCSVTFNGHTMNGTCRAGPDGSGTLACAPSGPPPQQQ